MVEIKKVLLSIFGSLNDFIGLITTLFASLLFLILYPILGLLSYKKKKTNFPTPKTIVITGATSGIGYGLALKYSKQKDISLGLIGRDKKRLEEIKNLCESNGANVEITSIDIKEKEKLSNWLLSFDEKCKVDVVIANAGIIESMLPEEMNFSDKMYETTNVNVIGTLNTILPLIPRFESRKSGQLVLMSSITPFWNLVVPGYISSKGFITSFGLTLRNKLSNIGVGVSVICLGFVETPLVDSLHFKYINLLFPISPEKAADHIIKGIKNNDRFIIYSMYNMIITKLISVFPPGLRDGIDSIISLFYKTPAFDGKKNK